WMCHSLARILAEKGEEANAKSVLLRGEAEVVENPRPVYRTIKSGKTARGLVLGAPPAARLSTSSPRAGKRSKPAWLAGRNHWTLDARSGSMGANSASSPRSR